MNEEKGWWRVVINNIDCPFRECKIDDVGSSNTSFYTACILRRGQFDDECIYINCKKRY